VGGMATVHRAELPGIEGFSKQVALKRMLPALADSEEGLSSFLREAQLASYLHHANVAHTYELGEIDGTYFIAMELINGHTLHAIMNRCAAMGSPMPVAVACSLLTQILDALDYAHNLADHSGQPLGIIHRDVSPSNVIVAADSGIAKLIDFGIAKASAAGMQTMNLTLKGKWAYMAPEYVELGQIDARADLFAVGVMAHELLVCRPLFSGADDVATLTNLRTMVVPEPSRANPSVPRELDHVVMSALARNPNARWQTAAAMRHALALVANRLGLEVPPSYIAGWMADLFGTASQFADDAPTMAGMAAYQDPDEISEQTYNPPVLDLSGTSPMPAYHPPVPDLSSTSPMPAYNPPAPEDELLELAPSPAPTRGRATPQGAPPQMSRPPGRMPTPAAASPVVPRIPTPHAGNPVLPRMPTPHAGNPVASRTATPHGASPTVPSSMEPLDLSNPPPAVARTSSRSKMPSGGSSTVARTATPHGASPTVARTATPHGASPTVARTATPHGAIPVAPSLDLDAPPLARNGGVPADFDPPMPGAVPRDFDPPMPGAVPRDFDPPMPGAVPRDFDPPMPGSVMPAAPRNEFAEPEVSADARPLSQMMTSETTMGLAYQDPATPAPAPPSSALPTPPPNTLRKAPRAATGAEPLWDFGGLKIEPLRPRVEAPTTAPVVVTVHDKKKDKKPRVPLSEGTKRVLIIAAAVLVTLGLAAAGYFLFA